jgi:hypothetical protein
MQETVFAKWRRALHGELGLHLVKKREDRPRSPRPLIRARETGEIEAGCMKFYTGTPPGPVKCA